MFKFIKRFFVPDCVSVAKALSKFNHRRYGGICHYIMDNNSLDRCCSTVSEFIVHNFPEWFSGSVAYPIADPAGIESGRNIFNYNVESIENDDNANLIEYRRRRQIIIDEMIKQLKDNRFEIRNRELLYHHIKHS